MVALEAWALGRPVLANGKCDVLKGQCDPQQRRALLRDLRGVRRDAARDRSEPVAPRRRSVSNGRRFFRDHYDWPVIERKYLDMFERLSDATARARPAIEPLPGWFARRREDGASRREVLAALPAGPCCPRRATRPAADARSRRSRMSDGRRHGSAVHQVLATLGYGDAIGHEVLGIQRVLRGGGIRVGHLRRDGRPPPGVSDARLPRSASRPATPTTCCSTTSRSARRRRAWPSRCQTGWRSSTTTSRRPSTSSACIRCSSQQCFRGRRELRAYIDRVSTRARRLGVQPAGTRGARIPAHRRAAGRPELLAPRRRPSRFADAQFDDDWVEPDLRRPRHPEQEDRGPDPRSFTRTSDASTRARVCSSSARTRLRAYFAMLQQLVATLACPTCTSSGTSRTRNWRVLRHRRSVPLRQRARGLLRAADRGVLQAGAGAGLRRHGGARHDGWRGRAVRRQGPRPRGALIDAIVVGRRAAGRIVAAQDAALDRLRARTSPARCSDSSIAPLQAPAPAHPGVTFDFWDQYAQEPRGAVDRAAGVYRPCRGSDRSRRTHPERGLGRTVTAESDRDDRQPVGAGRSPRRRHRRQRAPGARSAARPRPRVRAVRADDRRRPARRGPAVGPTRRRVAATSRSSTSRCRRR